MIIKNRTNSSWWLGNDFFSEDRDILTGDIVSDRTSELIKLSGYRRAISNFVNIVTGKSDIPVRFAGRDSYTDGKSVTISASIKDKDFDSTVGLALHEGSHVLLTDFKILPNLELEISSWADATDVYSTINEKYEMKSHMAAKSYVKDKIRNLLNIVEDRRIDNFVFKSAPGYKGYYHALYNRYFSSPIIDKALASSSHRDLDWNSYMFHIINITNANRDLNALPGLLDVYKVIDLANIDRLKSTKQSLTIALQIFQLVEANIPAVIERDETAGDNGDSSNDGDNGNTESTGGESSTPEGESKDDGSKADGDEAITGTAQGSGAGGLGGEDLPDLTTRQQAQLQKAIQKQKDFINNNIKKTKLNKTEQKKMQALDESGSEIKKVGRTTNRYTGNVYETECILVKKLTKNVIDNAGYSFLQGQYWKSKGVVLTDAVNKGVTLGRQLGKKLKLRSEERNTKFTRLDTGKIDKRLISSLGYGAERVFQQVMNDKFTPVNVHISIDASGSMHGSRFENCQTAVVAIAKAASMIDNMDIQVSYRTTTGDKPIILIAYDSRVDSFRKVTTLFKHICASNLTPEGLTFEAIKNELVTASGDKESYFINFSDGMPYCEPKGYSYYGASAVSHTRKQVDNMKLRGIKVLSYFIGNKDYNTSDDFIKMYGKSSRTIDVTSLIPLAKTLNKMFLTK
tara:strand:+ start:475 stop:2529 length:2055 start_codon:yes stop_codon:yes gene_type:complete